MTEYITIYLATAFNNVIVPIDKELDPDTLNKLYKDFDVEVLFCTNKTLNKVINSLKGIDIKIINIDYRIIVYNRINNR